jgi:chaperone BCS1
VTEGPELPPKRRRADREREQRERDGMSDLNTLSLSGLLNALDGVAAAEGRILFACVTLFFLLESFR